MGFSLVFADDDGVFGDFAGVGELVAEFFIGENDSSSFTVLAKLSGDRHSFFEFVFRNWHDGVIG